MLIHAEHEGKCVESSIMGGSFNNNQRIGGWEYCRCLLLFLRGNKGNNLRLNL